jgi:hypothetical protein
MKSPTSLHEIRVYSHALPALNLSVLGQRGEMVIF